jgi:hypothetical protein
VRKVGAELKSNNGSGAERARWVHYVDFDDIGDGGFKDETIGDGFWQHRNRRDFSIQLIVDSRMNHLEDRGNDTIQERSNSDFDVKSASIQFYGNSHNSQSDR